MWRTVSWTTQILFVIAKTLDNRLIDSPSITCGPDAIRIKGRSEDIFEGQIFIKNQRRSSDCFVVYSITDNSKTPEFVLPLSRIAVCGIDMRRNAELKSLELFSVFVFSFHPSFVTAGDRAFAIHCLFQQNQYTLSTGFNIKNLIPHNIFGIRSAIPSVRMSVIRGRDLSNLLTSQKVIVGQSVMLVWHLEDELELYDIRVLDCIAESRDGKGMPILRGGCSYDTALLSHVRYADHRQKAFSDAIAFKFPDQESVWFKCSVQLCLKRFDHLIVSGDSEDICREEPNCNPHSNRKRRSLNTSNSKKGAIIMVNGRITVDERENVFKI